MVKTEGYLLAEISSFIKNRIRFMDGRLVEEKNKNRESIRMQPF